MDAKARARAGSGNCYSPGYTLSPPTPRMTERVNMYAKMRELIKRKGKDGDGLDSLMSVLQLLLELRATHQLISSVYS